jgi:hypothetical protein
LDCFICSNLTLISSLSIVLYFKGMAAFIDGQFARATTNFFYQSFDFPHRFNLPILNNFCSSIPLLLPTFPISPPSRKHPQTPFPRKVHPWGILKNEMPTPMSIPCKWFLTTDSHFKHLCYLPICIKTDINNTKSRANKATCLA